MGESVDPIESLIDVVYDAVIDTSAWQRLAEAIDRHLDGAYVHLHAHDQIARSNVGMVCSGHSEEYIGSYLDHYQYINPLTPKLFNAPLGKVVRTEELVAPDILTKTEFYNDWFRPQDDCAIGCGTVLLRENGRMLFAGIHLRAHDVDRKVTATQHVLDRLRPHMLRAMTLRRSLVPTAGGSDAYRAMLDNIADAVFHLDGERRLISLNRVATDLCARLPRFRVDVAQRLHTGDVALDNRMDDLCRGRHAHILPFVIDARNEMGSLLVGQVMAVQHLNNPMRVFERDVCALLIVHMPGYSRGWSDVVAYFALTTAEASLAEDLVRGMTLDQCAARRGTSIHTVRNQLRAILAKTGTNRQSEMVGLLAPFAAPRSPEHGAV